MFFIAYLLKLLKMAISITFRGIYANRVARVSLFVKLLIQRLYGVIMYLANRLFFNLASSMVLVGILYVASLILFAFRALYLRQRMLSS